MRLLKIGSASDCDIVLNSPKVSGLHAEITLLNNGDILIEDKESRNGTFVNNQSIKPFTPISIKRGDYVRLANETLSWGMVPQLPDTSMYKEVHGIGSNMIYNDIHVSGNNVSRFHATLKIDKRGRAYIEDHSMNGTTVNGQKIISNQNVRVKRNDAVMVGGMPVDLKRYIKPNVAPTILKSLGGMAAVAAVVAIVIWVIGDGGRPPKMEALMKATPCVIGAFYVDVTIEDDPFKEMFPGLWPSSWRFGYNRVTGDWELNNPEPAQYNGTAFFISENGELGTNRHVAVPWKMMLSGADRVNIKMQIRQNVNGIIKEYRKNTQRKVAQTAVLQLAGYDVEEKDTDDETDAIMEMLDKCTYNIDGHHQYLGILLPGHYYRTVADLLSCQVIAESGDSEKDVAMIRMNDPHTPKEVMDGGFFDINKFARTDETTIGITESVTTIGYPKGEKAAYDIGNGAELTPALSTSSISKKPDYKNFQIQKVSKGGESGSPVIDSKRRLIGVLHSGYTDSEITYCCNVKHLVKLFEENKVRK